MLAVLLVAPLGATFKLSNAHLRLQIESTAKDAWFSFVGAPASGAPNLLSVVPQLTPLWEAQFATPAGLVQRTNSNATSVAAHATETSLTLEWSCSEPLDVVVPYIVRLTISLPKDARTAALKTEVENRGPPGARFGLWAITLTIGGITSESDDHAFIRIVMPHELSG